MKRVMILGAVLLAVPLGGWALHTSTQRQDANATQSSADASALAFMRGAWTMTRDNGDVCEETWSGLDTDGDSGGLMGMFRWIANQDKGGAARFVEIMTFREEEGVLVYRLRHFGIDLNPWEDTPVVLHVTEVSDNRIVMTPPAPGPDEEPSSVVSIEYRLENGNLVCDAVFNHDGERDELGFVFTRID